MRFDGSDIDLDAVQHATNVIGHGHQEHNDATHSQFNRSYAMGQGTFAGRVMHAALGSTEFINSRHKAEIEPMREMAIDGLRQATVINHGAQADVVGQLSAPVSGIGAAINPAS